MAYQMTLMQHGGIDQLVKAPMMPRMPEKNEVLIEHRAIGLNFIDIYHREGIPSYQKQTPLVIGQEAAGVITHIGTEVCNFNVGDRVAYAGYLGAYATHNTVSTERLVHLPAEIDDKTAASNLLRGATASYLLFDTFGLSKDHTALIHAGAGGVGQILTQWARQIGARVIATAGSEEKVQIVQSLGADLVINYQQELVAEKVRAFIPQGVDVVYDGVGQATFMASLDCLKHRGMMVSFGNASGAVAPISPLLLLEKGGVFLTRPSLNLYTATRNELDIVTMRWFDALLTHKVHISAPKEYPLQSVGTAQEDLAQRRLTGTAVLIP